MMFFIVYPKLGNKNNKEILTSLNMSEAEKIFQKLRKKWSFFVQKIFPPKKSLSKKFFRPKIFIQKTPIVIITFPKKSRQKLDKTCSDY